MAILREAVEQTDQAARASGEWFRWAAVIAITVLTALGSGAALLAASANWKTSVAQRARVLDTSLSAATAQSVQDMSAAASDQNLLLDEAYVRATVTPATDTSRRWRATYMRMSDTADYGPALAKSYRPGVMAQQDAVRQAHRAEWWLTREESNAGLIGASAVGLFFVAVALSIRKHRERWWCLGLAVVLAVCGAARMGAVNIPTVDEPPMSALEAYADGVVAADQSLNDEAVEDFQRAALRYDRYGEAWGALGDALMSMDSKPLRLGEAINAFAKALQYAGTDPRLLNNLAYAELLAHRFGDARRDINRAARIQPMDVYIIQTQAEIALALAQPAVAQSFLDRDLRLLQKLDPAFRDDVFSSYRTDRAQLDAAGITGAAVEDYFGRLKTAEASFDAYGRSSPGRTVDGGVRLLGLVYQPENATLTAKLACSHVTTTDILSIRLYSSRGSFLGMASRTRMQARPSVAVTLPLSPGTYTVEVYLNGHLASETDVRVSSA